MRTKATTSGDPLSPDDEILLPWLRNGVSYTVQWNDGTLSRSFYMGDLEVHDVKSGENNDFGIEVSRTINGSISYFGHMHYRQNRYRAVILIVPQDGSWKISNIEMIDEERLL